MATFRGACLLACLYVGISSETIINNLRGQESHYHQCTECISHGQQETAKCKWICQTARRPDDYPVPSPPPGTINTTCSDCPSYPGPSTGCNCCGENLCTRYYVGAATWADPYYPQYHEIARFMSNCSYEPNFYCSTCALWRKINNQGLSSREICNGTDTQCWVVKELRHTFMAANPVVDKLHYLVLPGSVNYRQPLMGIEDMQVLSMEETWSVAYKVALHPYENLPISYNSLPTLPVNPYTNGIGIAINPACARAQHQAHIHVEPVPKSLREVAQGGRTGAFRVWSKLTLNTLSGNVTVIAKYFKLSDPSFMKPFQTVYNLAGRDFTNMRAWGIVIIPDEEKIPAERGYPFPPGFYFITGAYNQDPPPSWNSYPQNKNWQPENLLCNCLSSGNSNTFWPDRDCPTLKCPPASPPNSQLKNPLRWSEYLSGGS